MPGPRSTDNGIVAYGHLLCAQMVSLKRTAAMIQAMTGAALRGHPARQALEPWEGAAIGKLLDMPVLHVDETSRAWTGKTTGSMSVLADPSPSRACTATAAVRRSTPSASSPATALIVHDCPTSPTPSAISSAARTCSGNAGRNRQQRLPRGRCCSSHADRSSSARTAPLHARLQAHRTMLQGVLEQGRSEMPPAAKKGPARTGRGRTPPTSVVQRKNPALYQTRRYSLHASTGRARYRMATQAEGLASFAHAYCRISTSADHGRTRLQPTGRHHHHGNAVDCLNAGQRG